MKKSDIERLYESQTGQTYKHEPLYIGDVYKNEFGVYGIVLARDNNGKIQYYYKKTNACEHILPQEKNGMNNSEYVANVIQDETLMEMFIKEGIIEDDTIEEKEEKFMTKEKDAINEPQQEEKAQKDTESKQETENQKPVKTKKAATKAEPKKEEKATEPEKPIDTKKMNIYEKINAIRVAWSKTDIEKAGKGRAGGGAKYDYYKPQQIIDFCLVQEVKHRLYSKFCVIEDRCYYEVIDLDNLEMSETVSCPFDIPRKMAASEAQQVGAAMTYHNRRLAMMMYKIEDNSKESVDVLEDADYTEPLHIPAPPVVPPAPIITPPPMATVEPPATKQNIQAEVNSKPVNESKVENEQTTDLPFEPDKSVNLAGENEQKDEIAEEMKQEPVEVASPKNVLGKEVTSEPPKTVAPPPVTPPTQKATVPPPPPAKPEATPANTNKKTSIEDLY